VWSQGISELQKITDFYCSRNLVLWPPRMNPLKGWL